MTIYNHSEGVVEETKTTKADHMTTIISKDGVLIASIKRNDRNNKTIEQYGGGSQWGITRQIQMSNGISIGPEGLKTEDMTMPNVWPPGPPKARKGTTIIIAPGSLYKSIACIRFHRITSLLLRLPLPLLQKKTNKKNDDAKKRHRNAHRTKMKVKMKGRKKRNRVVWIMIPIVKKKSHSDC